jgi:hypothetical protein
MAKARSWGSNLVREDAFAKVTIHCHTPRGAANSVDGLIIVDSRMCKKNVASAQCWFKWILRLERVTSCP